MLVVVLAGRVLIWEGLGRPPWPIQHPSWCAVTRCSVSAAWLLRTRARAHVHARMAAQRHSHGCARVWWWAREVVVVAAVLLLLPRPLLLLLRAAAAMANCAGRYCGGGGDGVCTCAARVWRLGRSGGGVDGRCE